MKRTIKILHLEDSATDAELVARVLKTEKLEAEIQLVSSKVGFKTALKHFDHDLILADHSVGSFNSHEALRLVKDAGIDVPFIVITATMTDEFAADMMKEGATDYIIKDRLRRLPSAVINGLNHWTSHKKEQENEERYRQIIEAAHEGIWTTDEDNQTNFANRRMCEILGYTSAEMLGKTPVEFVTEEDKPVAANIFEAQQNGIRSSQELRFITKRGKEIWTTISTSAILNNNGVYKGAVAMVNDITAKKLEEAQVRNTYNKLRFHIDNSPLGFIEWDTELRIRSMSGRTVEILGWSMDDVHYNDSAGFMQVYEEDRPWVGKIIEQLISGDIESSNIEHRNITKDGRVIWCEWFNSVFKNKDGKVITIMSLVQDITERKATEEKLIYKQQRLKEAQEIAQLGNWEIDLTTNIHYWSEEFYNIFGINKEEEDITPSAEAFLSFMHAEDVGHVAEKIKESFETCQDMSFDFKFMRRDGTIRYAYSTYRFEFDKNNKPVRLFGIVQDVTARKKLEFEQQKLLNELIRMNVDLKQFAFITSHNFRAPLSNITSILNLLNYEETNSQNKQLLPLLKTSAEELNKTIEDVTNVLVIRNSPDIHIETVSLPLTYATVEAQFAEALAEVGGKITSNFEVADVKFNAKYMKSTMTHLVSNAINFRASQRELHIIIESHPNKEGNTMLSISDNGVGIDMKRHADDVFGLYQRFHENSKGKGLGLLMVKAEVTALGGKISVESEVDKGTTFTITFKD